eukprot:TRINITY_DN5632_c0_g1_i3.p1 TRINITY_DN5632_c0_g1~~TRINITY_DN5632_c0_g1_i3.p1  ORF type:complete len:429 (+),score=173.54 TRINITY_DN5632_c0_g1_i3:294-1580(+)
MCFRVWRQLISAARAARRLAVHKLQGCVLCARLCGYMFLVWRACVVRGGDKAQRTTIQALRLEVAEAQHAVADMMSHRMGSTQPGQLKQHKAALELLHKQHAQLSTRAEQRSRGVHQLSEAHETACTALRQNQSAVQAQHARLLDLEAQAASVGCQLDRLVLCEPSQEEALQRVTAERDALVHQNVQLRLSAKGAAGRSDKVHTLQEQLNNARGTLEQLQLAKEQLGLEQEQAQWQLGQDSQLTRSHLKLNTTNLFDPHGLDKSLFSSLGASELLQVDQLATPVQESLRFTSRAALHDSTTLSHANPLMQQQAEQSFCEELDVLQFLGFDESNASTTSWLHGVDSHRPAPSTAAALTQSHQSKVSRLDVVQQMISDKKVLSEELGWYKRRTLLLEFDMGILANEVKKVQQPTSRVPDPRLRNPTSAVA